MKKTNLFMYAKKELSQDAFICWLISHLTDDGYDEDLQIRNCAIDFMNKLLAHRNDCWKEGYRVTQLKNQYEKIDIYVVLNNSIHIIIEDKTFTMTHGDQINRYKKTLFDKGISEDEIICVFYKIVEQAYPEKDVNFEFTRKILLDIFVGYKEQISNPIFRDYLDYLEHIEEETMSYKTKDITLWKENEYRGFFSELTSGFLMGKGHDWHYVSNPAGGFMGLWWYSILDMNDLKAMGLDETVISNLYLQIENDIVAVKYSVEKIKEENRDYETIQKIRRCIFDYICDKIEDDKEFLKKNYHTGQCMTVGYLKYTRDNCVDSLKKLESILLSMKGEFKYPK